MEPVAKIANTEYFNWLCELVDKDHLYRNLLEKLYLKEFYWSVRNDENRAEDGLKLREIYNNLHGYLTFSQQFVNGIRVDANVEGGCSVLEMLIGLAKRCNDDIMYDPKTGDETEKWFWIFLKNLKLDEFSDEKFNADSEKSGMKIDEILTIFLDRSYSKYGEGSLFPLFPNFVENESGIKNLKKVEIWYQLSYFLTQNYNFKV